MNSIVFENVCKSYGDAKIVKSLNLEIKEGEAPDFAGAFRLRKEHDS